MKNNIIPSIPLNININRDENEINDYLHCWSVFGSRPNKYVLHANYNVDSFIKYIGDSETSVVFTEAIPAQDDVMINEKVLVKIDESIYLSYTHFDKLVDESVIGDVVFFYKSGSAEKLNEIISNLEQFHEGFDDEGDSTRMFSTIFTQNGFEVEPLVPMKLDFENIEMYFNDNVLKRTEKLIKNIRKSNKGLSLIYGQRGTGKTGLVGYMASCLEKPFVYIPSSMIEISINNPEFKNLLKRFKNSVVVIDDSELYFSQFYTKSNVFTNNILQLIDGYQSDELNLNIIMVLNVDHLSEIDETILDCNNLIDVIEVDCLSKTKSLELAKSVGGKSKIKGPTKLIDVIRKREFSSQQDEIGFK